MSRKILYLLILSVLLSSVGFGSLRTTPLSTSSSSGLITVPDDYETIQGAINHRYDEDILVKAGIYYENIMIWKEDHLHPYTLRGEDPETTIIDGSGSGTVVLVEKNNVTVTGFTIRNSSQERFDSGIKLDRVKNCNVTGNIITNNRNGIYLDRSSSCAIFDNIIVNNTRYGIGLSVSNRNEMHSNKIIENENAINIKYSSYNMMHSNKIVKNREAITVLNTSRNSFFHNNFLNNTRQVYDEAWETPYTTESTNIWDNDYPSGGNYWSHYTGDDVCWGRDQSTQGNDRIIDESYVLYGQNEDSYPFIESYPMPDFQLFDFGSYTIDGTVCMLHLVALTNSSIGNSHFNSTERQISFNLIANISDSCRLIIPKHVLDGAFNFIVNDVPAACSIRCADYEHMVELTYGQGSYSIEIIGEIAETPPIVEFPDINGDGEINILDVATVAINFGKKREYP